MVLHWILRKLGRQDWIPFGVRDRIIRSFVNPDTVFSTPFQVEFFGRRYKGNLGNFIDWSVYFYGAYEKANLALLRDLVRRRREREVTFVDVGANVGQHSLYMSKYCRYVHAFEPWPVVQRYLEDKIVVNDIRNVTLHPVALGERTEFLPFYAPEGPNLGSGSFLREHNPRHSRLLPDKLQVVKGDDYFAEHGICPSLIKIDVEGFEVHVLRGMAETLRKLRPVILMEFSSTTRAQFGSEAVLQELLPYGYSIRRFIDRGSWQYQLRPFWFECMGGDILLIPKEMSARF